MIFFMVVGEEPPSGYGNGKKIDESLFKKIGQGDRNALEELYVLTERAVYAYVFSILKNPEDTQDIVQDTYLKIRSAAHLYQPQGKPMAWMFTIARNLTHNHLKKSGRSVYLEDGELENRKDFSYINDPTDRLILEAAFKLLSEEERQILLLHALSGMKHHEIAKGMGVPLSTVLSRYQRSLKKLRKYISGQEGGK
ncbi:MAG: RNA polymerase sigma factor [Clostridiaceae bacterium]|nr:RNA polymerase sigma factor [Clostridiaceae bacterium]